MEPQAATDSSSGSQKRRQRSVACQTDSQELDEATLRNELAMGAYLEILGVLDDDRQPVYHDLGEAYANKVFLQAMAGDDQPMEEDEEVEEEEGQDEAETLEEADVAEAATPSARAAERLQSLESQVIDAEWSLRCKLAQVRESAKHPVQRWLEGAIPITASASPFASRTPSVRQHQQQHLQNQHQHYQSATASHCSRPSSVAGLSEVFVSDSDDDDDDDADTDAGADETMEAAPTGAASKSEMTFYSCTVHGIQVPESFVRIKLKGGGVNSSSEDQATEPPAV